MGDSKLEKIGNRIAGPKLVAQRFGRGLAWGRKLLREWHEEDLRTHRSPPRVLRMKHRGVPTLYTTLEVLNAHAPPARDESLVRAVASLDKELDAFARKLVAKVEALEERVRVLERERSRIRQPGLANGVRR